MPYIFAQDSSSVNDESITVEMLLVEYKHQNGFNFGIDIQKAQTNNFGNGSYNPSSSSGNLSVLYDYKVSTTLDDSFILNLQAMVSNGDAIITQNPRVAVNNGKTAIFSIDDELYVQLDTASQNGITTALKKLNAGISLTVTPTIVNDSLISLSVIGKLSEFIPSVGGNYRIETNNINTNITMPKNETLIIGGMIQEEELIDVKGLPLISQIPLIGNLFSRKTKSKYFFENVIYITAYPTNQNVENKLYNEGYYESSFDKENEIQKKLDNLMITNKRKN